MFHFLYFRKLADGLFLNCCREVSKDYPDIEFNDMIIDNASMQVSGDSLFLTGYKVSNDILY